MRFKTGAILAFTGVAIGAPIISAEKALSEDLSRFLDNVRDCETCDLGRTNQGQLFLINAEGVFQDVMPLDDAEVAVVNELSMCLEMALEEAEEDWTVFKRCLDDIIGDDTKNSDVHQTSDPPVFRPSEQRGNDINDIPYPERGPGGTVDEGLKKRQGWKVPPVFRPFKHSNNVAEAAHIDSASPEARDENPTKNARPFDPTPSYMPPRENKPDNTPTKRQNQGAPKPPDEDDLVKRQWNLSPIFRPLGEPTTLEKRIPPRTALSTVSEPTSAPTTEPEATTDDDEDEEDEEREWCARSRKCTTSATCPSACDACTYVAWYPYGICMARDSGRGLIRD